MYFPAIIHNQYALNYCCSDEVRRELKFKFFSFGTSDDSGQSLDFIVEQMVASMQKVGINFSSQAAFKFYISW